jgi:hypothetical protein
MELLRILLTRPKRGSRANFPKNLWTRKCGHRGHLTLFLAKSSVEKLKKNTRSDLNLPKPSYGQWNLQKWRKSSLLNMNIFSQLFLKILFDRGKYSSWTALQA